MQQCGRGLFKDPLLFFYVLHIFQNPEAYGDYLKDISDKIKQSTRLMLSLLDRDAPESAKEVVVRWQC